MFYGFFWGGNLFAAVSKADAYIQYDDGLLQGEDLSGLCGSTAAAGR